MTTSPNIVALEGYVGPDHRAFDTAPPHWERLRPIVPVEIPAGSKVFIPQREISPPHAESSIWIKVQQFLMGDPEWVEEGERAFLGRVFRTASGPEDIDSFGGWRRNFASFYPTSPKRASSALFSHAIPWSDGVDNAGHYCIATRALQTFMMLRSDDPEGAEAAWTFFVDRALFEAGMIVQHELGNEGIWSYEKSSSDRPGDFYPRGVVRWSHCWPESVLLFHALTGELGEVVEKIGLHIRRTMTEPGYRNHQAIYNGHYGSRRCAWLLRALRCLDVLMDGAVTVDDEAAKEVLDSVFDRWTLIQGDISFIRQVPAEVPVGGVMGVWDQWLWLSEALPWLLKFGLYLPMAARMANYLATLNRADGRVPYTMTVSWKTPGKEVAAVTPTYGREATHSSIALPAMAGLAAMGKFPVDTFTKTYDHVADALPYGLRGNPVAGHPDKRTLPYGGAAPKTVASLAWGLIPAVVRARGSLG